MPPLASNAVSNTTTFADPAFIQWAQTNYPNTTGARVLTSSAVSSVTNTAVSLTAADIFPTASNAACGTATTNFLPCDTAMIDSTWAALRAQVRNGIHVGLCGIPWWGTDTGGFSPTLELTPELYVRWFQFSAFCPLFRSHGRAWKLRLPWGWESGDPGPLEGSRLGVNWPPQHELHDEQVERICREYLNLRYRLLPYLYASVAQTHETGVPLMRPLWFANPDDRQALVCEDEYLFGDSLLVAPVLAAAARLRAVYLPGGLWWDLWREEAVQGGAEISRDVDLRTMPIYVKAGAVVPMGPVKQYVAEPVEEPLRLRIYPGADGSFTLYEDDGESFRYREGEFLRMHCAWEQARRTLTLRVDPKGRPASGRKMQLEIAGAHSPAMVTLRGPVTEVRL